MMDESIVLSDANDELAAELNERINEFDARPTGINDGRLLQANSETTKVLSWQG